MLWMAGGRWEEERVGVGEVEALNSNKKEVIKCYTIQKVLNIRG
jgi:hypothetical protein